MERYDVGEHVRFWSYSYNSSGALEDATTKTIQIWDSEGTSVLAATAMTKSATGTYYYDYTVPAAGPFGVWRRETVDTTGGIVSKETHFFLVEGEHCLQTMRRKVGRLTGDLLHHGTADSGGNTTLVDTDLKEYANADITGKVEIISGLGAGQVRTISSFVGSSGTITVAVAWATNPDSTSVYEIYSNFGKNEINDAIRAALRAVRKDCLLPCYEKITPVASTYNYDISDDFCSIYMFQWDKGSGIYEEIAPRYFQFFYDVYLGKTRLRFLDPAMAGLTSYSLELFGQKEPTVPVIDEDEIKIPGEFVLYYAAMYVEMQRSVTSTQTEGTTDTETRERSDSGGTTALVKTGTTTVADKKALTAKAASFAQLAAEERTKIRRELLPNSIIVPRL